MEKVPYAYAIGSLCMLKFVLVSIMLLLLMILGDTWAT